MTVKQFVEATVTRDINQANNETLYNVYDGKIDEHFKMGAEMLVKMYGKRKVSCINSKHAISAECSYAISL